MASPADPDAFRDLLVFIASVSVLAAVIYVVVR
jgi:hypothetical protein